VDGKAMSVNGPLLPFTFRVSFPEAPDKPVYEVLLHGVKVYEFPNKAQYVDALMGGQSLLRY